MGRRSDSGRWRQMTDKAVGTFEIFVDRLEIGLIEICRCGGKMPVVAVARCFPGFVSRADVAMMAFAASFGAAGARHRVGVMAMAGRAVAAAAVGIYAADAMVGPGIVERLAALHAQIVAVADGAALFEQRR